MIMNDNEAYWIPEVIMIIDDLHKGKAALGGPSWQNSFQMSFVRHGPEPAFWTCTSPNKLLAKIGNDDSI